MKKNLKVTMKHAVKDIFLQYYYNNKKEIFAQKMLYTTTFNSS